MRLRRRDIFRYAERDVKTDEAPVVIFVANISINRKLRVVMVMNPPIATPGLVEAIEPERQAAALAIQDLVCAIDKKLAGGK